MANRLGFSTLRKTHRFIQNPIEYTKAGDPKPPTYYCETCRAEKQQKRASKDARREQ